MHDQLTEADQAFITSSEMFWLASVDGNGSPTVSYKGGAPGFVQVLDERSLLFPNYDGNGMYWSMGNLASTASIGMLFMSFERVAITTLVTNCPRYIPRMTRIGASRYIPDPRTGEQAIPGWKRIDMIQGVLPARDQNKAHLDGGLISMDEWGRMVAEGDPRA